MIDKLVEKIKKTGAPIEVGLDPMLDYVPEFLKQKAFAEYFGISKRAIESWEGGQRECPTYLSELMRYKLEKEGLLK